MLSLKSIYNNRSPLILTLSNTVKPIFTQEVTGKVGDIVHITGKSTITNGSSTVAGISSFIYRSTNSANTTDSVQLMVDGQANTSVGYNHHECLDLDVYDTLPADGTYYYHFCGFSTLSGVTVEGSYYGGLDIAHYTNAPDYEDLFIAIGNALEFVCPEAKEAIDEFFNPEVGDNSGGIITELDGYRYHTFNSSENLVLTQETTLDYFMMGGGSGGGGNAGGGMVGGGGGSGGNKQGTITLPAGTYPVIIGNGGIGGLAVSGPTGRGQVGGNTSFAGIVANAGGYGAYASSSTGDPGGNGGCGGGAGWGSTVAAGGTGISGQGYAGAPRQSSGSAGGGGGVGAAATTSLGGAGIIYNGVTYGQGGTGNTAGKTSGVKPNTPAANTGNGGHGGWNGQGGDASNGVLIIKYAL